MSERCYFHVVVMVGCGLCGFKYCVLIPKTMKSALSGYSAPECVNERGERYVSGGNSNKDSR